MICFHLEATKSEKKGITFFLPLTNRFSCFVFFRKKKMKSFLIDPSLTRAATADANAKPVKIEKTKSCMTANWNSWKRRFSYYLKCAVWRQPAWCWIDGRRSPCSDTVATKQQESKLLIRLEKKKGKIRCWKMKVHCCYDGLIFSWIKKTIYTFTSTTVRQPLQGRGWKVRW